MADGPQFSFHPLERRGLLLGLDFAQVLTVLAGLIAAVLDRDVIGGTLGVTSAAVVAVTFLALAIWTRDGRCLGAVALLGGWWALRRGRGPRLVPLPALGAGSDPFLHDPGAPTGIRLTADEGLPGEGSIGLVRDRRAGRWGAVIPVAGGPFSLLDRAEQAQVLDGWRQVLASVGRTGSPVLRFQWIQRSYRSRPRPVAAPPDLVVGPVAESAGSYRELMGSDSVRAVEHQAWLVVLVGSGPTRTRRSPAAVAARSGVAALRREVRLLQGQLAAAGLRPGPALSLAGLRSLLAAGTVDQEPGPPFGTAPRWPLASDDRWGCHLADGLWHVTYWIAEWPRVEVGPDFLGPLLLVDVRATVSVVMAPVPEDRAVREVRAARTADAADTELRTRAGFLPSARRQRESEGVVRRESELVDGHREFRFSGYLTVSAPGVEELAAACAEAERAAHAARLDLRRLYGRQAEAFNWTRPFGRGLR